MGERLESDADSSADLPGYAPMLNAYHRAYAPELRNIVSSLPLADCRKVLDLACGDGFHSKWLAERLEARSLVVGVDIRPDYLTIAERQVAPVATTLRAESDPSSPATAGSKAGQAKGSHPAEQHRPDAAFTVGSIESLPFDDKAFDLTWCAHSLYSLPEPVDALVEMRRVTSDAGFVAVLEQDSLHRVMLPWPAEVELAVQQALFTALSRLPRGPRKFFAGRRLGTYFERANLQVCRLEPYCSSRRAPLDNDTCLWMSEYLAELRDTAGPYLSTEVRERFDGLTDPESPEYMPAQRDFFAVFVDVLGVGQRQCQR
jgi:ubiquinone/menaquinone biosynthesis C-methylase UbiE